jgi:hypothetical protein
MRRPALLPAAVAPLLFANSFTPEPQKYQPPVGLQELVLRRSDFLKGLVAVVPATFLLGQDAADAKSPGISVDDEINMLKDGSEALGSLLDNWERATVDCTYADVPRDLLEAKNKELLLEKAKISALFDKSASVVSCRKNPRIVRDYLGATGKGPLVNAEKRFLKRDVADRVDPDLLDEYYAQVEFFTQEMAKASAASYTAGISDLDSINTFAKGEEGATGDSASLEQARKAIIEAKGAMDKAIHILTAGEGQ